MAAELRSAADPDDAGMDDAGPDPDPRDSRVVWTAAADAATAVGLAVFAPVGSLLVFATFFMSWREAAGVYLFFLQYPLAVAGHHLVSTGRGKAGGVCAGAGLAAGVGWQGLMWAAFAGGGGATTPLRLATDPRMWGAAVFAPVVPLTGWALVRVARGEWLDRPEWLDRSEWPDARPGAPAPPAGSGRHG